MSLAALLNPASVAIVGASQNPQKVGGMPVRLLKELGFTGPIYPINPAAKEVQGLVAYASLADLPVAPDLVDVFRRHEDLPGVAQEAIDVGAKALWLQLGSWNEDAAALAQSAGLSVVMDRCVKIEHARFHGGLHLAGFDTGVISSRRQLLAR